MAEDNRKACGMSRQSEAYENADKGLSESMREFQNEWEMGRARLMESRRTKS